jgi:hypothetical protein
VKFWISEGFSGPRTGAQIAQAAPMLGCSGVPLPKSPRFQDQFPQERKSISQYYQGTPPAGADPVRESAPDQPRRLGNPLTFLGFCRYKNLILMRGAWPHVAGPVLDFACRFLTLKGYQPATDSKHLRCLRVFFFSDSISSWGVASTLFAYMCTFAGGAALWTAGKENTVLK